MYHFRQMWTNPKSEENTIYVYILRYTTLRMLIVYLSSAFLSDTNYNVNEKKNLTIALTMIEKIVTHSDSYHT